MKINIAGDGNEIKRERNKGRGDEKQHNSRWKRQKNKKKEK